MSEIKIKTKDGKVLTILSKDGKEGPQGKDGYIPIKGKDYFDGKDGYTPIKGKDYFDGKDADVEDIAKKVLTKIKKPIDGKDGYTPIKGKDYFDGEKGNDGSPDTPEEVKSKLLKAGLDYEDIKNTPDIQKIVQVYSKQASKTTSLVDLDDVDYSGLSIVNGKYVLGGGSSSDYFETVSKNLKSYPYEITYASGDVDYITYNLGGGLNIVKTFNYTSGDITSIVLSGDTPGGINLTKTFSYVGGSVDSVVYS